MVRFRRAARLIASTGLLGALGLAACSGPTASWQLISPLGLPIKNHQAGALLFLDDSTGVLLGSAWSEAAELTQTIADEQVSTIFRTTDRGLTWRMRALSKGRGFVLGTRVGRAAYAVELRPRSASSPRDTSRVLRSTNGGETWQPLGRVPGRIFTLSFADTVHGFALTTTPQAGGAATYYTTDGGRHWLPAQLELPAATRTGVAAPDGSAWLLLAPPHPNPDAAATSLARVDWRTGRVTTETIPGGRVTAPPQLDAAGNLWLAAAAADGSALVLRRDARSGRCAVVHRFAPGRGEHLRPIALHQAGSSLSVLLTADAPLNQTRFYHSPDAGRTWRAEALPSGAVGGPVAFFGPEHVWLAGPGPQLRVRAPRF
ncbi:hypothetical protein GCM10027048_03610 [Hymenobacter coalescens]